MAVHRLMAVGGAALVTSAVTDTCEVCGRAVQVGEWPFCPHGFGANRVQGDDIPGGLTLENLGPDPVTVYSHSERKRIMRERGLQEVVRHVEGSPHTSRWV